MTREKGLETLTVLTLVSLCFYLKFDANWFIYLALIFLVIAILSKNITVLIGKIWSSFSHYLGMTMNYIIMFFIYFLILMPLSFLQRWLGRNQIVKRGGKNSHFQQIDQVYTIKDIEKPW